MGGQWHSKVAINAMLSVTVKRRRRRRQEEAGDDELTLCILKAPALDSKLPKLKTRSSSCRKWFTNGAQMVGELRSDVCELKKGNVRASDARCSMPATLCKGPDGKPYDGQRVRLQWQWQ